MDSLKVFLYRYNKRYLGFVKYTDRFIHTSKRSQVRSQLITKLVREFDILQHGKYYQNLRGTQNILEFSYVLECPKSLIQNVLKHLWNFALVHYPGGNYLSLDDLLRHSLYYNLPMNTNVLKSRLKPVMDYNEHRLHRWLSLFYIKNMKFDEALHLSSKQEIVGPIISQLLIHYSNKRDKALFFETVEMAEFLGLKQLTLQARCFAVLGMRNEALKARMSYQHETGAILSPNNSSVIHLYVMSALHGCDFSEAELCDVMKEYHPNHDMTMASYGLFQNSVRSLPMDTLFTKEHSELSAKVLSALLSVSAAYSPTVSSRIQSAYFRCLPVYMPDFSHVVKHYYQISKQVLPFPTPSLSALAKYGFYHHSQLVPDYSQMVSQILSDLGYFENFMSADVQTELKVREADYDKLRQSRLLSPVLDNNLFDAEITSSQGETFEVLMTVQAELKNLKRKIDILVETVDQISASGFQSTDLKKESVEKMDYSLDDIKRLLNEKGLMKPQSVDRYKKSIYKSIKTGSDVVDLENEPDMEESLEDQILNEQENASDGIIDFTVEVDMNKGSEKTLPDTDSDLSTAFVPMHRATAEPNFLKHADESDSIDDKESGIPVRTAQFYSIERSEILPTQSPSNNASFTDVPDKDTSTSSEQKDSSRKSTLYSREFLEYIEKSMKNS